MSLDGHRVNQEWSLSDTANPNQAFKYLSSCCFNTYPQCTELRGSNGEGTMTVAFALMK